MANHSITVTNALTFFGPSGATIWNAFTWGAANWGQSSDLGTQVEHVVDTTLSPTSDDVKYVRHATDDQALTLASELSKYLTRIIENSFSLTGDMYSERLQESAGYFYLYPDRTTEIENRVTASYASATRPGSTWTSGTVAATSWS